MIYGIKNLNYIHTHYNKYLHIYVCPNGRNMCAYILQIITPFSFSSRQQNKSLLIECIFKIMYGLFFIFFVFGSEENFYVVDSESGLLS